MSGPEWWNLVTPAAAGPAAGGTRYTIPPSKGGRPLDAYTQLAKDTASRHGLSPSLLAGVWDFESSGNPAAVNKSSGATGLGQVMPRERGFPDRPTQAELLNPETNAEWSARILKSGLDRYGSEDKALAAYLGAIDARGNITGAVDANGTGGNTYIRTVRERQQRYADLSAAAGPTSTPAPAGSSASEGAPGWWSLVSEQKGGVSAAAPARGGGSSPQAPPSTGGAVFPVAGYTGKVEFHHGSQQALGGSDLFAPEGTPVVAMAPGKVQWASNDSLGGHNVGVLGDDGLTYYYAHFKNAPRVKAGDRVGAGTQIGDVGRSGNAANTPPHLHIGIGRGIQTGAGAQGGLGREFDAVSYLRRALTGAAPADPAAPGVGRLTSSGGGGAAPGGANPSWWSLVE